MGYIISVADDRREKKIEKRKEKIECLLPVVYDFDLIPRCSRFV